MGRDAPALVGDTGADAARRTTRHNVVALAVDFGLFLVGLSFASVATILPAFARHLDAPNVVIGAIPAVMTAGWWLPSLFAAGHTQALERKLPFVLRYTVWERVPFLVLAAVAFWVAPAAPAAALAALLVMLLVITVTGGLLMPAWMDIVARTIPPGIRGRFFAVASVIGSLGGLGGSFVTAWILRVVAAPTSYALCFLIAAFFMGVSYVALARVREPPAGPPAPSVSVLAFLGRVPALVRRDANLAWFLVARLLAVAGSMAAGFYTIHALEAFAAPAWRVGVFTTLLFAGQTLGNLTLGWLADRAGHRLVVIAGVAATIAANALALGAPTLEVFTVVFLLVGLTNAAVNVSHFNIVLEFAPTSSESPTYVGLANTTAAPVALIAPPLAGLIADAAGFPAVFALAGVLSLGALVVLVARVSDPRRAGR